MGDICNSAVRRRIEISTITFLAILLSIVALIESNTLISFSDLVFRYLRNL